MPKLSNKERDPLEAAVVTLPGLPRPPYLENHRPYVGQAGVALGQAIKKMPMPQHSLPLQGHESWVTSAAFSPDGQRVITASADGTARVWPIRFATWQALAIGLVSRYCFTTREITALFIRN